MEKWSSGTKAKSLVILLAFARVMLLAGASTALAERSRRLNGMFYMCGSDLESKYGYATGNLEEIAECAAKELLFPQGRSFTRLTVRRTICEAQDSKRDPGGRLPGGG